MNAHGRTSLALLLVASLAAGVVLAAQASGGGPAQAADTASATGIAAARQWPLTGGDPYSSRYSALAQIDTTNVKSLGAAWVSKPYRDGAASRATPVISDGMAFITAGAWVYAFNAKTGEKIWDFQTSSGSENNRRGGVPNSQGPAVGGGMVFVGVMDGRGIALDEKTGAVVWSRDLRDGPPKTEQNVFAAPVYFDGVLYWGIEHGPRYPGRAMALDAKTGKELWRFDMIPAPGEPGHETWPQNSESWRWGSGSIWLAPALDPELGLIFYGTGNPEPVYSGEVRAGNNLYTSSVVALDIKTGKLKWFYQLVHHDVWEQDVATPVLLYDVQMEGRLRKGVAAMRPDGYLFLLDRQTGKPLIPVHERPVPQDSFAKTSPTQPFPDGDTILRPCEQWKTQVAPGFSVGCYTAPSPKVQDVLTYGVEVRFVPMSFDPQTGYIYVQGKDQLVWFRRGEDSLMHQFDVHGAYDIDRNANTVMAAIDTRTDKIVWKKILPMTNGYGPGGWLTTAGGLAFHRTCDGNFQAYDARTGDPLWQFQTGHPAGDSSPVTYELDGQQYVLISATNALWAFRLGGTIPQSAAPPAPRPYDPFVGPIEDATTIETASLLEASERGTRYWVDRTAFHPYRARVKVGAPVTFSNNGLEDHTIVALDGSWTTNLLRPADTITLTFDKPGVYVYRCKEHPWSYGQIIVVENSPAAGPGAAAGSQAAAGAGQAARGKDAYQQSCSVCHMANLGGSGEAAPALVGNEFLNRWSGRTAGDLFDKIRTTMPPAAAGSLSQQTYLDITAYMLGMNEIPAGAQGVTAESLKNLSLAK